MVLGSLEAEDSGRILQPSLEGVPLIPGDSMDVQRAAEAFFSKTQCPVAGLLGVVGLALSLQPEGLDVPKSELLRCR